MPRRGFGFGTVLRNRAALGDVINAFISVWNTENLGGTGSATLVILLPMVAGVEVDWGDGTINNLNTHTYAAGGIKTISIFEEVTGWDFANGGDKSKIIDVINPKRLNVDSDTMFQGCDNLLWTSTAPPIISATSLLSMFNGNTVINGNFDTWNTSLVTAMSAVFALCKAQIEVPDWDVGNCLSFASMFSEANDVDYDGVVWELKPAASIDCSNMFRANNCMLVAMTFTNSGSIDNHGGMYSFTIVELFPAYDYTNSANLGGMFQQANLQGTITAIDCPLNASFGDTFSSCDLTSLTGVITGTALLRTDFMLSGNTNLVTVGLFDTQNVTTARSMFNGCTSLKSLPAFDWSSCDNFTDFLKNVTIDQADYDALLIEIDANGLSNGTLDGGNSTYTGVGAGGAARASLEGKGWTITDGGVATANYNMSNFDTNRGVSVPDHASLDMTNDFAGCAFVYPNNRNKSQFILGKYHDAGNQTSWLMGITTSGAIRFWHSVDGAVETTFTSTVDVPLSTKSLMHFRLTGGTLYVGINGASEQSIARGACFSGTANVEVGMTGQGMLFNDDMDISKVMLIDSGFSLAKFATIYNGGEPLEHDLLEFVDSTITDDAVLELEMSSNDTSLVDKSSEGNDGAFSSGSFTNGQSITWQI